MSNKKYWMVQNGDTFLGDSSQHLNSLPVKVYNLQYDRNYDRFYLTTIDKSFKFEQKVYDIEKSFIDRVVKTYKNTKGNLGVLLNGLKGTGKSITAKLICNQLNLPVIIINDKFDASKVPVFLNSIEDDIIVFVDEYEKIYNDYQSTILTLMDGVLTTLSRRVFLLTTNDLHVNSNMLQRPGRIRYFKTFSDISLESVNLIIDDKLINKEYKQEIVKFLSTLDIVTVDIVKSIVEEVNIHNESPESFKDVFNVKINSDRCNIYLLQDSGKTLFKQNVTVSPSRFTESNVGISLKINQANFGKISKIIDSSTIVLEELWDDIEDEYKTVTLQVEPLSYIHQTFALAV